MSWSLALFTFLNAWWIMLFFVLPFGIRPSESANPQEYAAAPQRPNWKKKLWINTLLAAVVTLLLVWLTHSGLIPVKDM